MLNINFNLRRTESKKAEPINMVLRWDGDRLVYSTKIKVLPKHFDTKRQEVKAVLAEKNYSDLNTSLKNLKKNALDVFAKLDSSNNQISKIQLKKALDVETGRVKTPFNDFWSFIDFFIKTAPDRIKPETGEKLSHRTIQRYNTTISILREFEKDESGLNKQAITFDDIDKVFFEKFRTYLTAKNYTANTVAKHFETFKSFLHAAEGYDVKVNDAFKRKGIATATRKASFDIYLNEDDLKKLHDADLPPYLDRCRDLMLLSSYTGLRFSDWEQMKTAIFKDGNMEIYQYKTGNPVTITLKPEVDETFTKYSGKAPDVISIQKFNEWIKKACEKAGITEDVQGIITKGGKRTLEKFKKFEMVSSHTGRRSFATNEYINGMPVQTIMAITGHKSVKTFMIYLKLSDKEHAEIAKKHWEQRANNKTV